MALAAWRSILRAAAAARRVIGDRLGADLFLDIAEIAVVVFYVEVGRTDLPVAATGDTH